MKVLRVFTLVLLGAVALGSIGCGEDEKNDVKPEEPVVEEPVVEEPVVKEPVVEEPVALSDEEARKKSKSDCGEFLREKRKGWLMRPSKKVTSPHLKKRCQKYGLQ